jgi:MIP family channel proteins
VVLLVFAINKYLAELISTFSLVFIGAGAILSGNSITGVALAHGLVLMAMIYATAHISGAHVNPAVTIAMWVTKKINIKNTVFYIFAQLLGAAIAGFLLLAIFPNVAELNLGATSLAPNITLGMGILIEAILTFFLVFTIFGVSVDQRGKNAAFGLAIGVVLTFDILLGGNLTGASMNPARSFGPALASGFWKNHIVYWVGPLIGSITAALIYNKFLLGKE